MLSDKAKQLRQHYRKQGLCAYCGCESGGKYECPKCSSNTKRRRILNEQRRVNAGLCIKCSQPALKDKRYCEKCHQKLCEGNKIRKQKFKQCNLCVQCGTKEAIANRVCCEVCSTRNVVYSRQRNQIRRKQKRCVNCNKPTTGKSLLCKICTSKKQERDQENRRARKEAGICARCNAATQDYYAVCKECRDKQQKAQHAKVAVGLCYRCSKPREDLTKVTCFKCRKKYPKKET